MQMWRAAEGFVTIEFIRREAEGLKEVREFAGLGAATAMGLRGFVLFEELPGFFEVECVSVDD
jgi:hypothetical protein